MKIAFFSPLPPHATGIAAYSAHLLPHLAHLAEVTVFTDAPDTVDPALNQHVSVRDLESFAGPFRERFEMCMYQMGNNFGFHAGTYATLLRYPGVTTLHDVNLNSFYGDMFMTRGRAAGYTRELAFAYGLEGVHHARSAQMGLEPYRVDRYPLFERIARVSLGVIVHSHYARRIVASRCPRTPVVHINQLVPVEPDCVAVEDAKACLGFDPDNILLASFGYIAPSKRINVALEAFARIHRSYPNARYVLVGRIVDGYDLLSLVTRFDLERAVRLVGYADDGTFQTYLRATDIGINLRYPTLGETSATLLALMAAGKATLVSRVDAFEELPEAACVKIDVGPGEIAQTEALLAALIEDQDLRWRIGANAANYVRRECDPAVAAARYFQFAREVLGAE